MGQVKAGKLTEKFDMVWVVFYLEGGWMVRETLCLERMFQGQMHVTHEHTGCMYVCTVCIASTTRAQPLNTREEGSEVMANLAVCAKQTNEQGRPHKTTKLHV